MPSQYRLNTLVIAGGMPSGPQHDDGSVDSRLGFGHQSCFLYARTWTISQTSREYLNAPKLAHSSVH